MNDLRHDQEADDAAIHARLKGRTQHGDRFEDYAAGAPDKWFSVSTDNNVDTRPIVRMDVAELRTVQPPDLRIPGARPLSDFGLRIDARPVEAQIDAQARDLRTAGDKARAEFVRLVDCLQELKLRVEVLETYTARTIAALEAYIRDHSEADE
mgnify:CR=1 FL=1